MLNSLRTTLTVLASIVMLVNAAAPAQSADASPLQLETKIVLGDVRGSIDHMAIDLKRQRLFVAELGNDSVGIVDLANRKMIHRIPGLKEPQGVGYEPSTDMLYVANAGDGSVRLFEGNDYKPAGQIELGSDADNIRALMPRLSESSSDMAAGRWPSSILRPAARLVTFLSGPIPKPSRSIRIPAKFSSTFQMPAASPSSTASRKSKSEN